MWYCESDPPFGVFFVNLLERLIAIGGCPGSGTEVPSDGAPQERYSFLKGFLQSKKSSRAGQNYREKIRAVTLLPVDLPLYPGTAGKGGSSQKYLQSYMLFIRQDNRN